MEGAATSETVMAGERDAARAVAVGLGAAVCHMARCAEEGMEGGLGAP